MSESMDESRRRFFRFLLTAPLGLAAGAGLPSWAAALAAEGADAARDSSARPSAPAAGALSPTPECGDDDEPTPAETQGPFFTPNSPLRTSLIERGTTGTQIVVSGSVFARDCRPLPGVLLDFWHADDEGEYDNVGYKLRGHQLTDANGRYRLETIVPGLYPGRTRHFHVRVQPPHGRILTTQLYFPGEPRNRRDFLYRPDLLLELKEGERSKLGRFHFMLETA
jgi:protocatechuate 3,4-dioxygenase beta subunit